MKRVAGLSIMIFTIITGCHKATMELATSENFEQVETDVITDFVNNTGIPQYDSLVSVATQLNTSIGTLQSNTTDANLAAAQIVWKNIRTVWEQCEGFLIGPVETYDYDPNTDTWPTDHTQLDSLLSSSNSLQVSDIESLPQNLRGYHPIEYLLFRDGEYNVRTASSFTPRELQYLTSLSADILSNNVQPLLLSWISAPVSYAQAILTAGNSTNQYYPTKLSFFLNITGDNGMAGICNEVGEPDADGKMYEPYIDKDSTITESPYSDNSLIDFRNNIIGAQNVYLGLNGGKGVKDLVAAKNKDLDNQIQTQFTTTINSFNSITERYELAIFDQRVQIEQTLTQLQTLQTLLNNDLASFITENVKD